MAVLNMIYTVKEKEMIFNILNNLETFEKYFPGSEGSLAPWIPG